MPINIPTALTWLRILMIPLFTGVYYLPAAWMSMADKNLLATALFARFGSRGDAAFANRLLSALRREFGGHEERGDPAP